MMHKGGSAPLPPSTADARPAPGTDSAPATTSAATETLPAAPPLLRPAPFFLVASHFFVAVCALPELMDEISTALKQLEVSFTMKPSSCKVASLCGVIQAPLACAVLVFLSPVLRPCSLSATYSSSAAPTCLQAAPCSA